MAGELPGHLRLPRSRQLHRRWRAAAALPVMGHGEGLCGPRRAWPDQPRCTSSNCAWCEADGKVTEPMVQKHWRQEWRYEPASVVENTDHESMEAPRTGDAPNASGQWSQQVFQVDESPRYGALGRWEHNAQFLDLGQQRDPATAAAPRMEHAQGLPAARSAPTATPSCRAAGCRKRTT